MTISHEHLPIDLWHLIFDYLELTDFPLCALVSKKLYSAVKGYRIQEIAFTGRVYHWFHLTTKPSRRDYKHRTDFANASILKKPFFNSGHLKRLKIGHLSSIQDLKVINEFVHLEELDIDLKNYDNEKGRTLSLASLKLLYVFVPGNFPLLELDTPKLAKVYTLSLKRLEFIHPKSVQCVHTFYHAGKLPTFCNLECLVFTNDYNHCKSNREDKHSDDFQRLEEFSFSGNTLKNLKEIDFYFHYFCFEKDNMRNFKRMVENILAQGRQNLKVFWFGLQISDLNLLTEYERFMGFFGNFLVFHFLHYEKSKDKIDFFSEYNFNNSMKKLSEAGFNIRSEKFISKLLRRYSIRRINAFGKVVERELLMELIARSSDLSMLHFSNSGLDQSFFDQMTETVRLNGIRLNWLLFENSSGDGILNYEFVTKLTDLDLFETDQRLPNELVSKLLTFPMVNKIEFSSGWFMTTTIERMSSTRYLLNGKSLSLHELLERFDTGTDSTVLEAATAMMKVVGL